MDLYCLLCLAGRIRVNGVLPWFTRTEMVKSALEDAAFERDLIAATPLGRLAEPADVACVAAFLALPDSAYVTGQLIAMDGGYLAQGCRQKSPSRKFRPLTPQLFQRSHPPIRKFALARTEIRKAEISNGYSLGRIRCITA